MSRQSDDPLALIPTIDDDSDVPDFDGPDEDDDDEEEMLQKTRAHKLSQATKGKSIDFNDQFQFLLVKKYFFVCFNRKFFVQDDRDEKRIFKGNDNNDDYLKARGQLSSIDGIIAEVRNRRKKV